MNERSRHWFMALALSRRAAAGVLIVACCGCAEAPPSRANAPSRESPGTPSSATAVSDPDSIEAIAAPAPARSPAGRYLIIHADDAGMCRSVNRATIDALEHGAVSSASIMVPCPAFDEFAEYARTHPQYDYGIHLTLNAEYRSYRWGPVRPSDDVPSLVDADGFLWRSEHATASNARADDVERELRAQIDKALKAGVPLTHLDTHMGTLFLREDFLDIYLRLGAEYRLPVLLTRDDELAGRLDFDTRIIAQIRRAADQCEREAFPVLDKILMHYTSDSVSQKKRTYLDMIRRVPPGVTEIVVHCGYADDELRSITGMYSIRDGDRRVFTDPDVIAEISNQNVSLISWRQLTTMRSGAQLAD